MACGPGKKAMAFDATNPEALKWAESRAAGLVTEITASARDAIRQAVTLGFENGVPPKSTARVIRASIGLTERDAGAVMKRQLSLLAKGVNPDRATRAAERYAAKLTQARANTIARTETMRASNEGQQQLWNQAADQGLLAGNERKVWFTADPCPLCAPMDGVTVPLRSSFDVGDPPLHPNCRCTIGIVS